MKLRRTGTLSTLALLVALACTPSSASALISRVPTSFSPINGSGAGASFSQNPKDVAVDETNGNLLVLDGDWTTIRIFDEEGGVPSGVASPYVITGLGSLSTSIEVDNAAGSPSKGAVYAASQASNTVKKFVLNSGTETYEPAGELIPSPSLGGVSDIAVDTHGNVFVSSGPTQRTIVKFSPSGTELLRIPTTRIPFPPLDPAETYRPLEVAVDATGNLFVKQLDFSGGAEPSNYVWKYPVNGSGEIDPAGVTVAAFPQGPNDYFRPISIDPAINALFVTNRDETAITQYNTLTLAKELTFGREDIGTTRGRLAASSASGRVFVAAEKSVIVFTDETVLADLTPEEVLTDGTKATLRASVNAQGVEVTDCKFEFGSTAAYGTTIPCEGAIPTDSTPHTVTAALSGLTPNGATYHYRVIVTNTNGTNKSVDATFASGDIFATGAATAISDTTATLQGTVSPEGSALTECKFEYGETAHYGSSKPCNPAFGSIPADFGDHPVSAALTGLAPNHTYHFRIVATNSLGTFNGADQSFTLLGPPLVTEAEASPIGQSTASIVAQVTPRGFATNYHFEYGTNTTYGTRIPAESDPSVGLGTSPVEVSTDLSGLQEHTTYHFRVVATNSSGTTNGPDTTFTTTRENASCPNAAIRSGQTSGALPDGSTFLPECMALEMVSPPKKYNSYAEQPQFSATGDRVRFLSLAALAETPNLGYLTEPYTSTRTSTGWITQSVAMPPPIARGPSPTATPCSYSPDLSRWATFGTTSTQLPSYITTAFQGSLGESFTALSPTLIPTGSGSGVQKNPSFFLEGECFGASADVSHFFFSIANVTYLADDPEILKPNSTATTFDNVYEAYLDEDGTPTVRLLQRDGAGTIYGGSCGAIVGGIYPQKEVNGYYRRGTISSDASLVYFTARPDQTVGVACDPLANKRRILRRVSTSNGPEISVLSSECDRVAPACSAADADDLFLGASQEGSRVYFETARQLADSDLDEEADLYLFDSSRPEGERLTQVSAGDSSNPIAGKESGYLGLADFSGDGTRAYFAATGVLSTVPNGAGEVPEPDEPNLYLFERNAAHPGGRTVFIATLTANDEETWTGPPGQKTQAIAVPRVGSDIEDPSVGGDGHVLVFASNASLASDDTDGGHPDIYRYDANTESLRRISRAAPGGSDNGPYSIEIRRPEAAAGIPGHQSVSFDRWVSEDGRTIVFEGEEKLDPNDTTSKKNLYIWYDGSLTAVPPATKYSTVSLSGGSVAFVSEAQLLPQDGDGTRDVYVVRINGGFLPPAPPSPCEGEVCQGPAASQPGIETATESSVPGNSVTKPAPRCRKGFAHRGGKCVKRQGRKAGHRKRASHKQGGQK